jgi:hypothetical protein
MPVVPTGPRGLVHEINRSGSGHNGLRQWRQSVTLRQARIPDPLPVPRLHRPLGRWTSAPNWLETYRLGGVEGCCEGTRAVEGMSGNDTDPKVRRKTEKQLLYE